MNRSRIIVTVCHPDGNYQMVEVPSDHRLTVDGMGAVILRDLTDTPSDASDLPMHLRLLAHPFTGLSMASKEREVIVAAADLIEKLEANQ